MAKKKHTTKKHKFKHAEPGTNAVAAQPTPSAVITSGVKSAKQAAVADMRDFSYVFGDLRRIAILAVALVGLELVLWYILNHSGLGAAIYRMINI